MIKEMLLNIELILIALVVLLIAFSTLAYKCLMEDDND